MGSKFRKKFSKFGVFIPFALIIFVFATVFYFASKNNVAVMNPQGFVANNEHQLFLLAIFVASVVVLPAIGLTLFVAWHFREENARAKYTPDWIGTKWMVLAWWLIPITIVSVMGVVMIKYTHMLDPYKPINSTVKPITIQVIALQWKWLFIYPKQNIATINYIEFPVNTPINFELTANAPMNSFWIPQLGGQIYAMPGMSTHTHFIADKIGQYKGSDAEISGKGFATMKFIANAVDSDSFVKWVNGAKKSNKKLTLGAYHALIKPTESNPVILYSSVDAGLYNEIINEFYPYFSINGVGH